MRQISLEDSEHFAQRILAHHSFPGASCVAIQRVLAKGDYISHPHGATLCAEGDPGNDIFFLASGKITVTRKDASGIDRILSDMTSPYVFGHMAVIDGSRRSATCRANGPVNLVMLHRNQVDQLISEGSIAGAALRRLLVASLCDQLSSANSFVRKIVHDHAEEPATPEPAAKRTTRPGPSAQRKRSPKGPPEAEDLLTLAAKLGGWDPDELLALESEIEIVMDEDQKRTLDSRRGS
jgi:CRP-like cAMP-binding protein